MAPTSLVAGKIINNSLQFCV